MTTISPIISTALSSLDLTQPEADVYLALLELGPQPASAIARKAGLKRGHTYNMLDLLIEKGIVQQHDRAGTRYFSGCDPASLISILKRRQEEIESKKKSLLEAIPDLEHIRNPQAVQPKVRFFQGIEGIKEMYEETIRVHDQDIYAFGDFDHFFPRENSPELNDWIWSYCNRRAERKITYIGIVNKSETTDLAFRKRKEQRRKLKMLQGIDLPVEINIFGDKVAIISSSKDMVGLIVEDAPTADTLRNVHQVMWNLLPDYC